MESSPSRLAQGYLVDSDQDSPAVLCPGYAASLHRCACHRTEHGADFADYTLILE